METNCLRRAIATASVRVDPGVGSVRTVAARLLRAAELLRDTGPKSGPLAWTKEDADGVNRFIAIGRGFWWGAEHG